MEKRNDRMIYLKKSMKTLFKHPNVRSIFSLMRYFPEWRKYLAPGRNSIADKIPWITFSAIDFLKKISHSEMHIFEYGSGGSTLFWASRVKEVVSVEHDRLWYEKIRSELRNHNVTNIKYILSEAEPDNKFKEKSFENPADYISKDENFTGKKFEAYVKQIDQYPDEYFHIVVVDGRARPSCISHALKKVKKGGYLIVDNSERDYYLVPFMFKKPYWRVWKFYGPVPYIYHFSETTIMKKDDMVLT